MAKGITTKYGNFYTEQEWAEMMASYEADAREAYDYLDAVDAIIRQGAKMIEKVVGERSYSIARRIFNSGLEGITASSPERQALIEAVAEWMASEERSVR